MAPRIQPNFWVEGHLPRHPSSAGTDTIRWSDIPRADATFKEGRVRAFGTFDRSASDNDGSPVRSRASIDYSDADNLIRTMLADPQKRYLLSKEVSLFLQSESARLAGATPDRLFTGVIRETPLVERLQGRLVLDDWLMSRASPFSADRKLGAHRLLTRDLFPEMPRELIGTMQRWILGEVSDAGLTAADGTSASVGAVVCPWVGGVFLASDGGPIPAGIVPEYLQAPSNLVATVNGTPGATTYMYGISGVTRTGETNMTVVVVTNGPATLDDTNNITLTWDDPAAHADQLIAYRVSGRLTLDRHLEFLTNGGTYSDPENTWTDTGVRSPRSPGGNTVNTATIQVVIPDRTAVTAEVWQTFFVCGHAVNPAAMHTLYGPVWAEGQEPYRAVLDEGVFGVDVLAPGRPGWPHANDYVDVTDLRSGKVHRCTLMYARGPRAHYAAEGRAGFAWNMCGVEENGDGTGEPIRNAFYLWQFVLSVLAAENDGEGYYTGLYSGLPYFKIDPTLAMIDTDSVQAAQDFSAELVGPPGYRLDTILDEEITVAEFQRRFNTALETMSYINRFGQAAIIIPDMNADGVSGNHYREGIEIIRLSPPEVDDSIVENFQKYVYYYNFEKGEFRGDPETLEHLDSQEAYLGGVRPSPLLELKLLSDRTTAQNAMARRRTNRAYQRVWQSVVTDLRGLREEIGNQVLITHREGLGVSGWEAAPFIITRITTNADLGEVTLRGFWVGGMVGLMAPLLADADGPNAMELGDSDSSSAPPTGAFILS